MTTYTQIIYHIVFATKNRDPVLEQSRRRDLFAYIWGVVKHKNCQLYRINGVEDHVHLLTHLHPDIPLSSLVRDIKVSSAKWIKENNVFANFCNWQDGYGAFTHSLNDKDALSDYISRQEEHHKQKPFLDEYRYLLSQSGLTLDDRYLP